MTITVDVYAIPSASVAAIKSSFGLTFPYEEHAEPLTYVNAGTGEEKTGPALVVTTEGDTPPYSLILLKVYSEIFRSHMFLTANPEDPGYYHGAFAGVIIPRVSITQK